jgi:hypothetical protein
VRNLLSGLCLSLALTSVAFAQGAPSRLTQLHDDLHLTPQQESAWNDYAAAVAPDPQAQARRRATQQMLPQLTTPRRIALIDAAMDQDLADFHRQGDATLAFYGRLTPAQQQVFDRDTSGPGGASPSGH